MSGRNECISLQLNIHELLSIVAVQILNKWYDFTVSQYTFCYT